MRIFNSSSGHLFRRVLRNMALRITLAAFAISAISYYYSYQRLQEEALIHLAKYIDARSQIESSLFINAEGNTRLVRDEFIRRYGLEQNTNASAAFDQLLRQDKDGMWRIKYELDDFEHRATIAILPTAKRSPEFKRQVVLAYDLLSQYGPAFSNNYYDTFIDLNISDANLMYLPQLNYARSGSLADFAETVEPEIIATPAANPQRASQWTGIYYDKQALEWMVSIVTPIDYLGKYIGSVGQDVLLTQLIARTNTVNIPGTYNFIISRDGHLISHPNYMQQIQQQHGKFQVANSTTPLKDLFAVIKTAQPLDRFIETKDQESWLGIAPIKSTNWLFVTVYPKKILQTKAAISASIILLLGMIALALELGLLAWVLKTDIIKPLTRLKNAIQALAQGKPSTELDTHRDDEIGELARSFRDMAQTVQSHRHHLEELVNERTQELASRNLQLQAANEALKYLNHEKNELLTIAAHDLKNPVASIQGMSVLLKDRLHEWPSDKIQNRLSGINQLAGRIQNIIGNLIDHNALETGSVRLVFAPTAIDGLIEDVMNEWQERLAHKQQHCHYQGNHLRLTADRSALWQVLDNLISNAVKYAPHESTIVISTENIGNHIEICVSDQGPGVAPHEMVLLFKKFSRLSARPTGGEHTTGLGLSISKRLIEAMNGEIRCESQFGHGARFIITLPLCTEIDHTDTNATVL
ncbi:sensor histidine kinase [Deefgea sp. CFH1-16]|uniref:ATP-binding response regulator n=1 Tax=Deefgea sp. CFH1-16 TaxID=2675457 RepID=UPI0015F4EFEE|nr:sensor histidine kinase [Deefgea sp. CFH1-16]MBM5575273.1 HAMP domain-containing protein [Deefgea sp. CFH1-16]